MSNSIIPLSQPSAAPVTSVNGLIGAVVITPNLLGIDADADGIVDYATSVPLTCTNKTGGALTKGMAVYVSGAQGSKPTIAAAISTSESTSAKTVGILMANTANNADGQVIVLGLAKNLNTSAFTDGDVLYLSATVAGGLQNTQVLSPNHLVFVAYVVYAHAVNGILLVNVQNGNELDELHNVLITAIADKHIIEYEAASGLWKNVAQKTASTIPNTPAGNIAATTVQAAINELDSEKVATSLLGAVNGVATLDASGLVPVTQLPPAALERLVVVADQTARYALTTTSVQNGDTVKQTDTGEMWYVVDQTNLGNSAGYAVYSAGTASAVAVSGVTGLGTGVATFLATPSSANLASALTTKTGTGNSVFSENATLTGTTNIAALTASGLATLNGKASVAAGTVSLPGVYHGTDTATGWYRIGLNNNGYSVNGTKLLDLSAALFAATGAVSSYGGSAPSTSATGATLFSLNSVQCALNLCVSANSANDRRAEILFADKLYFRFLNDAYDAAVSALEITGGYASGVTSVKWLAGSASCELTSSGLAVTGAISATTTGKVGTTLAVGNATPAASGAGVTFPATQSASSDANTLDDYDEYTAASTACTGAITTSVSWRVVKVGNLVTLTIPGTIGTASATTNFVYGAVLPAKYRPVANHRSVGVIADNSQVLNQLGVLYVETNGTISCYKDQLGTATFTAGVSCGLADEHTISWVL